MNAQPSFDQPSFDGTHLPDEAPTAASGDADQVTDALGGQVHPPLDVVVFEHGADDACAEALLRVHAFLSNQLPATEADLIRAHLDACEKCLDDFDIEATIGRLLKRSCQSPAAPDELRLRIMTMSVTTYTTTEDADTAE